MAVIYEFGGFRLDPERRLLARKNGTPIELAPRAFDALLFMISRPGELIEKPALMRRLWPNVTVVENSLDQIVSRLRRALDDANALIATDRGRGYRFVGAVRAMPASGADAGRLRSADEDLQIPERGGTHDRQARELYLQALTLWGRPSPNNRRAAMELFDRALHRDPQFAEALAHRAQMRIRPIALRLSEPGTLDTAEREARAALEAASDLATAHLTLAHIHALRGDWNVAKAHYDIACRRSPEARFGRITSLTLTAGHLRRALEETLALDAHFPAWPIGAIAVASASLSLGRDEQAERYMDTAEALGWPADHPMTCDLRASLALRACRFDEAKERLTSALGPDFVAAGGARAIELSVSALQNSAHRCAAVDALRSVAAKIPEPRLQEPEYNRLAMCFGLLDAAEDLFRFMGGTLDRLAVQGIVVCHSGGFWSRELQGVRRHPHFRDYIERTRLPVYWERYGAPDGYMLCNGMPEEISA